MEKHLSHCLVTGFSLLAQCHRSAGAGLDRTAQFGANLRIPHAGYFTKGAMSVFALSGLGPATASDWEILAGINAGGRSQA